MTTTWTDDMREQVDVLWRKGWSTRAIALHMGNGLTRNAIIGVVNRLRRKRGEAKREKPAKAPKPVKSNVPVRATSVKRAAPKPLLSETPELVLAAMPAGAVWEALPGTTPIGIMDLERTSCRWPIGERPTLFCGVTVTAEGKRYCPTHQHHSEPRRA